MGNDISRARVLTTSSFVINFATQIYGMAASPNMKEVADANHFAFSPNPWFIAAFFSGQVVLQLTWIRQLFRVPPVEDCDPIPNTALLGKSIEEQNDIDERRAWKAAIGYAPVYALGNLCIAGWLFFWRREQFTASQGLVTINTLSQLAAVAVLPPLPRHAPTLHRLTHAVAKTFAGIGVLDLLDNGGVMLRALAPPSGLAQALTCTLFPIAAAWSSPLFGAVLLYDITAIAVGQAGVSGAGAWPARLGWAALATGVVVGGKGVMALRQHLRR